MCIELSLEAEEEVEGEGRGWGGGWGNNSAIFRSAANEKTEEREGSVYYERWNLQPNLLPNILPKSTMSTNSTRCTVGMLESRYHSNRGVSEQKVYYREKLSPHLLATLPRVRVTRH